MNTDCWSCSTSLPETGSKSCLHSFFFFTFSVKYILIERSVYGMNIGSDSVSLKISDIKNVLFHFILLLWQNDGKRCDSVDPTVHVNHIIP